VTTDVEYCARHPEVETALRCGRCETLICPRCMVYTPAGVRCPDCAQMRRLPMYQLSLQHYLRAAGIAIVLAGVLGVVAWFLPLPAPGRMLLFGMLIALVAGMGGGQLVATALYRGTGGKRGRVVQSMAVACVVAAAIVRFVLSDYPLDALPEDFAGLIMVGAAILTAWGRLR
jgi:hypothetical protein